VHKYVRIKWIQSAFVVKIGDRIGGKVWCPDHPDGPRAYDFRTDWVLADVRQLNMWEEYWARKFEKDPDTGRLIEVRYKDYRPVKIYLITIKSDDGKTQELMTERDKERKLFLKKPAEKVEPKKEGAAESEERDEGAPVAPFGGRLE
jgi:hypothetical protein